MIATEMKPPPLDGFSADRFRCWLAGYESTEADVDDADTDQLRGRMAAFIGHLPIVYGFDDRVTMWERIGNAVSHATASADGDMGEWTNIILERINAPHGIVASHDQFQKAMSGIVMTPVHYRAAMMRLAKTQSYVLLAMARELWQTIKIEAAELRESRKESV